MEHTLFTIGYSGWKPHQIQTVVARYAALLVDIRFSPRSRVPHWERDALERLLGEQYLWERRLGNRNYQTAGDICLYEPDAAIAALTPRIEQQPLILLCGCPRHETCHRGVAADLLAATWGCAVQHLYPADASPVVQHSFL